MKEAAALGAWTGDLSAFGRFWARRAALLIRIGAPAAELDPALGFEVAGFTGKVRVLDSRDQTLDFAATTRDGRLFLARPGH